MTRPIQIFRLGRHVDTNGQSVAFSSADLDAIVASYDPKVHEAPIVLGHPKDNDPAFGWVKGLARKGDTLEAVPDQVETSFAEAVKEGRYKKVSASFYKPNAPNNPKPGSYYLRHVGFLGAMPPAVKGLRSVEFADNADDCVSFEELAAASDDAQKAAEDAAAAAAAAAPASLDEATLERLVTYLTSTLAVKFGLKPVDAAAAGGATADHAEADPEAIYAAIEKVFPAELAEGARAAIKKALTDALGAAPTETTTEGAPTADLSERERNLLKRERELRQRDFVSYVEGLVREGRPLASDRDRIVGLLETLSTVDCGEVSFGEGEKRSPADILKALLDRFPKQVDFSERGAGTADFADGDPKEIARAATAYQDAQRAKGVIVSTSEAVNHVTKGR